MNLGWIKIHRDMSNWEWYQTPNMVQFFVHCLLRANHGVKKWQGITIECGQFISGRKALSKETGLSEQTIRTCINRLKSTNELTIKNMAKYSVFTLNNWKKYQVQESPTTISTINQPSTNHQLTTNKNEKNEKKNKPFKSTNQINLVDQVDQGSKDPIVKDPINNPLKKKNSIKSDLVFKVIDTFNKITNKSFKRSKKTIEVIEARIKEGFTFEEFEKVIALKNDQWANDDKMSIYIRPITIFGPKFEGYLNETPSQPKKVITQEMIDEKKKTDEINKLLSEQTF